MAYRGRKIAYRDAVKRIQNLTGMGTKYNTRGLPQNLLPGRALGPSQSLSDRWKRRLFGHKIDDKIWGTRGLHQKYSGVGFTVVKKDDIRPATLVIDFGLDAAAKMSGLLGYGSGSDWMLLSHMPKLKMIAKERFSHWIEHTFDSRGDPPGSWRPYSRYSRAFSRMKTHKVAVSRKMSEEVHDPRKPHVPNLIDTGALAVAMRKAVLMQTLGVYGVFNDFPGGVAPGTNLFKDIKSVSKSAGGGLYGFAVDLDHISPRDEKTGYEYAWAHEFGTSRLPARPFVFPGIARALNEIAGAVNYNMRKAVEKGAELSKAAPETSVIVYPHQVAPGGAFASPTAAATKFRPDEQVGLISMPTTRLTAFALMWWLLPPSRIWAAIGAVSDIGAIMSGELLQARYLRPWIQNFMLGKMSTKIGVPLTKKFARRGFRRKMYRGRGKYKKGK